MKTIIFLPDNADAKAAVDAALQRRPKALRIEWSSAGALEDAIAKADPKQGFAIVAPPLGAADLAKIDEVAGRPRAVIFAVKGDAAMKAVYGHYHASRREITVKKAKALSKAVATATTTESWIRWNAVVPMVLLSLVASAAVFVARDAVIHKMSVAGLELAAQARAEVGALSTTLTPSLQMTTVAVANRHAPDTNLLEFDRLSGGIDAVEACAGRVRIDELALEGLRFGGTRKESGALPGVTPEPTPTPVPAESTPTLEGALDGILKKLEPPALDDLESLRAAKAAEKEMKERAERLKKAVEDANVGAKLDAARKTMEELKSAVELPGSVKESLGEIDAIRGDLKGLDAAKAGLEAAAKISFDDDRKKLDSAKADVESARDSIAKAEELTAKAKEIQKVRLTDLPKVKRMLDDMGKTLKGLESSGAKVQSAAATVEQVREGVERRKADAAKQLDGAGGDLAKAKELIQQGGPDLEKRFASASGKVAKAKADLDAKQAEIGTKAKDMRDQVDKARGEAETLKKQVQDQAAYFSTQPAALKKAVEQDQARMAARYDLDAFNADALVGAAFGPQAVTWLNRALYLHHLAQPWLATKKQEAKRAKLAEGTVYVYPATGKTPPRFWILKAKFSGSHVIDGETFTLTGTATNIASDLAQVGQDATMDLALAAGSRKISARFKATPAGDLTSEVEASGFAVKGGRFDSPRAPVVVGDGTLTAKVSATFEPGGIKATAHVAIEGLKLALGEPSDPRCGFLRDIFKDLGGLGADIELGFAGGKITSFKCRSDKGGQLTGVFRKAMEKQVEEARKGISAKIEQMTAGPVGEATRAATSAAGDATKQAGKLGELISGATPGAVPDPSARFAEARAKLDFPSDPAKAVAQLSEEVNALEKRRTDLATANAAAATDLSTSGESIKALGGEQGKKLDVVKAGLKAEIDRLVQEMK